MHVYGGSWGVRIGCFWVVSGPVVVYGRTWGWDSAGVGIRRHTGRLEAQNRLFDVFGVNTCSQLACGAIPATFAPQICLLHLFLSSLQLFYVRATISQLHHFTPYHRLIARPSSHITHQSVHDLHCTRSHTSPHAHTLTHTPRAALTRALRRL